VHRAYGTQPDEVRFVQGSQKGLRGFEDDLLGRYRRCRLEALVMFGEKQEVKYPMISQSWVRRQNNLSEFFKYPLEIRRAIYTTNAVESLNCQATVPAYA